MLGISITCFTVCQVLWRKLRSMILGISFRRTITQRAIPDFGERPTNEFRRARVARRGERSKLDFPRLKSFQGGRKRFSKKLPMKLLGMISEHNITIPAWDVSITFVEWSLNYSSFKRMSLRQFSRKTGDIFPTHWFLYETQEVGAKLRPETTGKNGKHSPTGNGRFTTEVTKIHSTCRAEFSSVSFSFIHDLHWQACRRILIPLPYILLNEVCLIICAQNARGFQV